MGSSEYPCITANFLTDFLNSCNVFDNLYVMSDLGVNWNAVIIPKIKGQLYNPGNALVRYEFLEILVRIAHDRYIRTKQLKSILNAITLLFESYLLPYMIQFDSNKWRVERYWNEDVELTFKAYKAILDAVYQRYSGRKSLPGQKPFVSVEEFRDLCNEASLVNDWFTSRDIELVYGLGMMTRVDEIFKKTHVEMKYVEFLEAIGRLCDMASYKGNLELTTEELKSLPLSKKIQNIMPKLLQVCYKSLQISFVMPTEETIQQLRSRQQKRRSSNI
jgi:hypothetical protein